MALNGIDVSGWQSTIDISRVPCDFVIAKATGRTKLVSSACDKQIQAAKKAGNLWGFYHFAREKGYGASTAEAEAKYFVKNCKNYFGSGVPVLDFEQDVASCGVTWAKTFLDTVHYSVSKNIVKVALIIKILIETAPGNICLFNNTVDAYFIKWYSVKFCFNGLVNSFPFCFR